MHDMLEMQKLLVPDLIEMMKIRHIILRHILMQGIVGRRALAASTDMTERVLRSEVNFLKQQRLIEIEAKGMQLTELGKELLMNMDAVMKVVHGYSELETQISQAFQLKRVVIVPGDADTNVYTKKELGRVGAQELLKYVMQGQVIAVTGGSTMAEVANYVGSSTKLKDCWFVPARGGLGERVELQANHIASAMAKRIGGQYRLMHVAEQLGEEVTQSLAQDPQIKEIIEFVRTAKVVIHGIGEAMVMANRRKVSIDIKEMLAQQGALAEAFGYYFDRNGQVVHKTSTVGLRLEDLAKMEVVIGVAGGKSKGESIAAFLKHGLEDILVIDEIGAIEVLKHVNNTSSR